MSIAFDATSGTLGNTVSSLTFSHTCTGTDLGLFVGTAAVSTIDANRPVTGVTYNGVALTKIREDKDDTNNITSGLWYLVNPSVGTFNIVVSYTGNVRCGAGGVSLTGVHQSSTIDAQATAADSGTDTTVDITTLNVGSWIIDAITDLVATAFDSAGADQTIRQNLDLGAQGSFGMSTAGPKSPAGIQTMTWSQESNNDWITSVVAVKSADATTTSTSSTSSSISTSVSTSISTSSTSKSTSTSSTSSSISTSVSSTSASTSTSKSTSTSVSSTSTSTTVSNTTSTSSTSASTSSTSKSTSTSQSTSTSISSTSSSISTSISTSSTSTSRSTSTSSTSSSTSTTVPPNPQVWPNVRIRT